MEHALRIQADETPAQGRAEQPKANSVSEGIEKVLRFAMPTKPVETEHTAATTRSAPFVTAREFAAAIDGVHEAAQAMKAAEERSREAETRTQTVAQRAAEELKNAEARIQTLEARVRAAENRASDAEARAQEADAWLRQILATIAEELPGRRPAAG
jgi:uncharacterized protein YlxW (UPF0749 family)